MANDQMSQAVNQTSLEYVENGLLFFVHDKINFMIHDDIIELCKDFYSDNDVSEAKTIMYAKYNCPEKAKTHRGTNKKSNDLKEIVGFVSQNVVSDFVFCITRCTQVPAVVMDYIDAAAINRHVTNLRAEMAVTTAAHRQVIAKVQRLENLFQQQQQQQKQKQQHRQQQQQSQHLEQQVCQPAHSEAATSDAVYTEQEREDHRVTAAEVLRRPRVKPRPRQVEAGYKNTTHLRGDSSSESDGEWFVQRHQRKKSHRKTHTTAERVKGGGQASRQISRRPAVIGTREGSSLRAAQPVRDVSLFVSRLSPDVESEVVRLHVVQVSGVDDVVCQMQEQRHPNYRSFKVTINGIPKEKIKDLYKADNWDKDILVKRWYE